MVSLRRSDTTMPAMAIAQSAREMLRRVLGGRTRTKRMRKPVVSLVIRIDAAYRHMTPKWSVSLQRRRVTAPVGDSGGTCEVGKGQRKDMNSLDFHTEQWAFPPSVPSVLQTVTKMLEFPTFLQAN
jgi:hypothetical protein